MLHRLSPQAYCVTHASRSCAGVATQREPWYGTAHRCAPIDPAALALWATDAPHPALRLPAPNPFIATDFGLLHALQNEPEEGQEDPQPRQRLPLQEGCPLPLRPRRPEEGGLEGGRRGCRSLRAGLHPDSG